MTAFRMSQSPLARSSRRPLPRFAITPSQLSKSTSSRDLLQDHSGGSSRSLQNGHTTPAKLHRDLTSSPHTPKIHYSPYATSSPHGGLSKSTSIPFDMAASAKAARQIEQEKSRAGSSLDGDGLDTPLPKKKRFVRRKPLWER